MSLQTSLQDPSLSPHHLCSVCRDILLPFLQLKQLALKHERFLLKYQAKIKQFGVSSVKSSVDDVKEAAEDTRGGEAEEVEDENHNEDMAKNGGLKDVVHCRICGPTKILKKSSLNNHLRIFHKEKDVACEILGCGIKFKKKSDMKKHIRNVHNNEKSLCMQCGDSFKDLNYHIKVFHENVHYPCDICSKVYTTKQGLAFHMKHSHGNGKKEVCHICAVEVKHVRHHIKMKHSGSVDKNIPCQDKNCIKKFRTKQEASIHFNSAHLNKKEMCTLCKQWFKNLYNHIHQTHENEKKHVCDQCGKAFGKKNDLKVHKDRIHLFKRYICPKCGKTISKIREHLKTVHNVTQVNMEEIEEAKKYVSQPQQDQSLAPSLPRSPVSLQSLPALQTVSPQSLPALQTVSPQSLPAPQTVPQAWPGSQPENLDL